MAAKKNKKLTPRQLATLKKHSKHHTAKHMKVMVKDMKEGKTFTQAHKLSLIHISEPTRPY